MKLITLLLALVISIAGCKERISNRHFKIPDVLNIAYDSIQILEWENHDTIINFCYPKQVISIGELNTLDGHGIVGQPIKVYVKHVSRHWNDTTRVEIDCCETGTKGWDTDFTKYPTLIKPQKGLLTPANKARIDSTLHIKNDCKGQYRYPSPTINKP
jgi:hypothetical protein